jgi:hypothetical protein
MATPTIDTHATRQTHRFTAGIAIVWIVAILAPSGTRLKSVGVAIGIGAGVIALLSLTGNLSGPAFDPFDSVLAESVVALAASGIIALGFARFAR